MEVTVIALNFPFSLTATTIDRVLAFHMLLLFFERTLFKGALTFLQLGNS